MSRGYNAQKEEVFEIKDDLQKDQSVGYSSMNATRAAKGHPQVRYEEKATGQIYLMTCDVYIEGDELMVHMYCPKCRHNLAIKSSNKQISYDMDNDRLIFVEAFKCSWEMDDELLGETRKFGFSLCNWNVVIDNGLARDV